MSRPLNCQFRYAINLLLLVPCFLCGGCRRAYQVGNSITQRDLTNALPEYWITLPPGSTNLYLEHRPNKFMSSSWYKLTVPRVSLTNFLQTFGVLPDFMPVPPQMLAARKSLSSPPMFPSGLDKRSAAAWLADIAGTSRRASHWDLEAATVPLRMYMATRPGLASPRDEVLLSAYTDDTINPQATVWLEYVRFQRQ